MSATIGHRICTARTAKGLSMEVAAGKVGVSKEAWRLWEVGETSPRRGMIPKIAALLEVDPVYLETGVYPEAAARLSDDAVALAQWFDQLTPMQRRRAIAALLTADGLDFPAEGAAKVLPFRNGKS